MGSEASPHVRSLSVHPTQSRLWKHFWQPESEVGTAPPLGAERLGLSWDGFYFSLQNCLGLVLGPPKRPWPHSRDGRGFLHLLLLLGC